MPYLSNHTNFYNLSAYLLWVKETKDKISLLFRCKNFINASQGRLHSSHLLYYLLHVSYSYPFSLRSRQKLYLLNILLLW